MSQPDIDRLVSKLDGLHFEVAVLLIDNGVFQRTVLENWTVIMRALRREAERSRRLSVVKG